jgi:putative adhesin
MRLTLPFVLAGLALPAVPAAAQDDVHRVVAHEVARAATARAYQGRNSQEQTERVSRKVRIGRDGRVTIANISGEIVVTAGGGDEVSIEAVKRTRGDRGELADVEVVIDERAGRVDIRAEHGRFRDRGRRGDSASVDFTVTIPASASLDVHSVSGSVKITGVRGSVRAESVSGNVTTADTPNLEHAKSVSGDVSLTGAAADGDLTAGSVSGNVTAKGLKARGLDLNSVSGDLLLTDVTCERLTIKTVSGEVGYTGTIVRNGRYEINTHSGDVRLTLSNPPGFELNANSFSGSVRSDLPLTIGGDSARDRSARGRREQHNMRATFGDGSATLNIHTFSGEIVIAKR